jgi:hypothetical protein
LSSSKGRDNNSSLRPVLSHPDREQNSGWTRGKREAQLSDGDDHRCAVQRFRLHLTSLIFEVSKYSSVPIKLISFIFNRTVVLFFYSTSFFTDVIELVICSI